MFKKLLFPLIVVLVFLSGALVVMADDDTPVGSGPILEDSSNELFLINDGDMSLLNGASDEESGPVFFGTGEFKSSSEFITDEKKSSYIDRMTKYYIENNERLQTALADGKAVVMFFEGGSDTAGDVSKGYRNAAVCLVIRQDSKTKENYIAYYNKNSTTYPDYPYAFDYVNGHDGYGSAVALDGIYNIYTHNHNSYYAAFNVRSGDKNAVPCIYMNKNGSFSVLNGTGINLHLRPDETVSGDVLKPNSAGCLLVGGTDFLNSFKSFLDTVDPDPDKANRTETNIQGIITLDKYNTPGTFAGCVVIDRYLGKETLNKVYENPEAVEAITAFSTFNQKVQEKGAVEKMKGLEYYSSYLTGSVAGGKTLLSLPSKLYPSVRTRGGKILINGLFKTSDGLLYYRVYTNESTYYIAAGDVTWVSPRFDDVYVHSYTYPEVKQFGNSFSVKGIIGKKYNVLSEVTGAVLNSDGSVNSSYTADNILASLAISNEDGLHTDDKAYINSKLKFGGLPVGSYTYKVTANVKNYYVYHNQIKCKDKEVVVLEKKFITAPLVTFNAGDGTVNGSKTTGILGDGSGKIKDIPTPVLEGKYFDGWYTGDGAKVSSETVFTTNSTVTAKWSDTPPEPEKIDKEKKKSGKKYSKPVKHYSPARTLFSIVSWWKHLLFWWV